MEAEESVGWGKMDMGPAEPEPREPEPEPEPPAPAGLPGEPEPEPEEGVPPEEVGYWEAEGIPGVALYDEHTRARQKGRLQITRSQLSFYPTSGGGRPRPSTTGSNEAESTPARGVSRRGLANP